MRLSIGAIVISCAVVGFATQASAQSLDEDIAAAKAASEKYQDVNVALAEGFVPDPSGHCIPAGAEGLPPDWGRWAYIT